MHFYRSVYLPCTSQYDAIIINFEALQLQREANHTVLTIKIAFINKQKNKY